MKNIFIPILLLTVLFTSQTYGQTEIGGVSLSDTLKIGDDSLVLNGGGIREKFWLDLYVGGLYLTQKESNAQAIIDANQPMVIYLDIVSGLITSEKMIEAVDEGFQKSTQGNIEPLKNEIESFKSVFSETIKEKDTYTIAYSSDEVTISKNGKKITSIQGMEFKKALFGIWLGEEPADENLKQGMLGLN